MSRNETFDFRGQFPKLTPTRSKNINLFRKEVSLIFIVGIIGCVGTLLVFNKAWFKDSQPAVEKLTTITIPDVEIQSLSPRPDKNLLSVQGQFKVNADLEFQIMNYNPQAAYEIHFGDGTSAIMDSRNLNYVYKTSGKYQVQVKMHFKEQISTVYSKDISITKESGTFLSSI